MKVTKANKAQTNRVVKMMREYFGNTRINHAIAAETLSIEGNQITWKVDFEWNEKFHSWFNENRTNFNTNNLWYENQNGYTIHIYLR
jgi:hypothetical protein